MEAPASFGRWLKLRRRTLDVTQDELARQVGCSVVTIRKLESDDRRPSRQIAERLAECLRIGAHERAAFIGLARAEPYLDESPASMPEPSPGPAPQRTNLPAPLTRLIGRRQEAAALQRALQRGDTRLLTLTGPPGVGKTRLAVQAAGELRHAFADGVYFIDLAPIRDPELVVSAIAQALGIRELGGRPLIENLHDYLHARRVLLLLDNFEQVLPAAPRVVELLEGCSSLKALVTSRASLHVRGEYVIQVAPLPLPDRAASSGVRILAQNPAVALFVERAQAVQPAFRLASANAADVAELCARLEGLPLAIELMAVRVNLLPLRALLGALDRRLALLTDGPRDLPLRHQTLRAAIAGSYELLESHAQALFRRLSVFVGGWAPEAAEAVCRDQELRTEDGGWKIESRSAILHPPSSILAGLAALVDKSLIRRIDGAGDAPRFTMLETIREYALELLVECGEANAMQQAHATFFLGLAERAERELRGPDQVAWLDRLELEHPNLRAALDWCLEEEETRRLGVEEKELLERPRSLSPSLPVSLSRRELALRLGWALWWFWYVRGYSSEGRRWLDRMLQVGLPTHSTSSGQVLDLEQTGRSKIQNLQPNIARALHAAGHLALFQGDFAVARERLGASAAIWRELAAADQQAHQELFSTLAFLIVATQYAGDTAALEPIIAEFVRLSAALEDPRSRAMFLFNLGRGALLQQGNYMEARTQLEQSLALFRSLGDLWYLAQVVIDLGLVALFQEDNAAAQAWYQEGLSLARALKDRGLIALALNNLGEVARCQDDDERAAQLYTESLQVHQDMGNQSETPRLLHNLGYVALHRGDSAQATAYFRESLGLFRQLGMARGMAESLAGLAAIAASRGQASEAARLWGAAEALHETVGTPVWPADRREQARYQAIARAQLDPAGWQAAWQAGRANPPV